jgi:dimethylaniline monooxygenase (N-oxide forming)
VSGPRERDAAVCVIGAGVGGIAAMRPLGQAGIAFDCFDERDRVGGIWAYEEEPGRTCAWAMLNMNSPRGTYDFSDFPMPAHYPDFPRREQVWAYLDAAIDHYGLRPAIRLDTRVERVEKAGGAWRVTLAGGDSRLYRAVVVANGHHNIPRLPEVEGSFAGRTMHSRDYRRREPFAGRRVLVVGYGNSGAQIAVDVSFAAEETLLAMRSGTYVLPHYVHGLRVDRVFDTRLVGWLPHSIDNALATFLYRVTVGRVSRHLPKPRRGLGYVFATIAENLVNRIGDGRIRVTREPLRFDGRTVTFADGASAEIDDVIYATGYHTTFPFLDEAVFAAPDNRVRLYMRTFLPDDPSLTVIGAYQANAQWGFLPLMEAQARLVAAHLAGEYALPDKAAMLAAIEREQRDIARRFLDTPRHHYQMLGPVFLRQIGRELKRGARRARAAGPAERRSANETAVAAAET